MTLMESSRRDLLNDMAEHRPILKNNQNTYHPRFGFTPKTGKEFLKTGFCFYCEAEQSNNYAGNLTYGKRNLRYPNVKLPNLSIMQGYCMKEKRAQPIYRKN